MWARVAQAVEFVDVCDFCCAVVGEVISEPMLLEQYVAIADYKKKQKNEVNLSAGIGVEVVEKNENGQCVVLGEISACSFYRIPAVSFTIASLIVDIALITGCLPFLFLLAVLGWWFVNVEDEQGWVPASYLEPAEGGSGKEEQLARATRGEGIL